MKKQTIYICTEIKNREYVSNIFLAMHSALRGYRVYLGTHAAIYALMRKKIKKDGIFLDKSTQPRERMQWNRERIEYYCILDPELSPIMPEELLIEGFMSRIYPGSQELIDKFFVVGESTAKAAQANIENCSSIVRITGWPRIDIWKTYGPKIYQKEIDTIRTKHAEFLLFLPSFGNIRDPELTKRLDNADPINVTLVNDFQLALLQYSNFKKMIKMLRDWDSNSLIPKVIVKVHPSEPISEWIQGLKGLKKTIIVKNGDVSPWIVASSAVIHHGSTGAIEAHYAKKPVLILKDLTVPFLLPIASGISQYQITQDNYFEGFNFSKMQNFDFDQGVLSNAITDPTTGATTLIIDNFDDLRAKSSNPHKRAQLIFSQINLRSVRRAIGLLRDEVYWKFGRTNIN